MNDAAVLQIIEMVRQEIQGLRSDLKAILDSHEKRLDDIDASRQWISGAYAAVGALVGSLVSAGGWLITHYWR